MHLSVEEYAALRRAAADDPAEADRMCREFLTRPTPPAETDRAEEVTVRNLAQTLDRCTYTVQ